MKLFSSFVIPLNMNVESKDVAVLWPMTETAMWLTRAGCSTSQGLAYERGLPCCFSAHLRFLVPPSELLISEVWWGEQAEEIKS